MKCPKCGSNETWTCSRILPNRTVSFLNCFSCSEVSDVPDPEREQHTGTFVVEMKIGGKGGENGM
jgi:hypothetical protein